MRPLLRQLTDRGIVHIIKMGMNFPVSKLKAGLCDLVLDKGSKLITRAEKNI